MQKFDRITCGCYYCLAFFPPRAIEDWADTGSTAICPCCGVDSIIIFSDRHNIEDAERTLIECHHKSFKVAHPIVTATQVKRADPSISFSDIPREDIEIAINAPIISFNGKTESTNETE